jgi:hypothetical protein
LLPSRRSTVTVNLSALASVWRAPVSPNCLVTFITSELTTNSPSLALLCLMRSVYCRNPAHFPPHPMKAANGRRRCTWMRFPSMIWLADDGSTGALRAYLDPDCPDAAGGGRGRLASPRGRGRSRRGLRGSDPGSIPRVEACTVRARRADRAPRRGTVGRRGHLTWEPPLRKPRRAEQRTTRRAG